MTILQQINTHHQALVMAAIPAVPRFLAATLHIPRAGCCIKQCHPVRTRRHQADGCTMRSGWPGWATQQGTSPLQICHGTRGSNNIARDKMLAVALAVRCYGVLCQSASVSGTIYRKASHKLPRYRTPPVYFPPLPLLGAGPNIRDPAIQWSRPIYGAHETIPSGFRGEVVVTMGVGGLLDQGILRH